MSLHLLSYKRSHQDHKNHILFCYASPFLPSFLAVSMISYLHMFLESEKQRKTVVI